MHLRFLEGSQEDVAVEESALKTAGCRWMGIFVAHDSLIS